MTAQINDRVFHCGRRYSLAGMNGEGLFDPSDYGLKPESCLSACWRGYHVDYEVRDSTLLLTSVTIGLSLPDKLLASRGQLPFAPGVIMGKPKFGLGTIEGLSSSVPYTGGLLIADNFIRELYVHMGFHPAWKFQDVRELIFEHGRLLEDHDRSSAMAALRERLAAEPLRPDIERSREVGSWIERCFSRNYGW